MNRIETIKQIKEAKELNLAESVELVRPESGVHPQIQAEWMVQVLSEIYVRHGITANVSGLEASIQNGDCRCWFALEDEEPISCVALVRQADGAIELGRAASLNRGKGVGSLLMLESAIDHFTHSDMPLVAEVRMAADFEGVPGSEATQVVMLRHIGLEPHALVPMFGHGDPCRQEQFVLGSSEIIQESLPMWWPETSNSKRLLHETVGGIVLGGFLPNTTVGGSESRTPFSGWEVDNEAPFAVLKSAGGTRVGLEQALEEALGKKPFVLMPIPASPENSGVVDSALENGLVPCGVDRSLDDQGFPILLFGKLDHRVKLAPIVQVPGIFNESQIRAMKLCHRLIKPIRNNNQE